MLKSTAILFGSTHDVLTEEVWMNGKLLSSNVRHIPGFEQTFEMDDWQTFLRNWMNTVNRDPDSFENITRVIAVHGGKSFLVETENA